MRMDVDTVAVSGAADAVRRVAAATRLVDLPHPPPCEDLGAADAVRALLAVSSGQLAAVADELAAVAVLVDVAAADYARAEARAAAPP